MPVVLVAAQRAAAAVFLLGTTQHHHVLATRPAVKHASAHPQNVESKEDDLSLLQKQQQHSGSLGLGFDLSRVMWEAQNKLQWDTDQKDFLAEEAITQMVHEKHISAAIKTWRDDWDVFLKNETVRMLAEVDDTLYEEKVRYWEVLNTTFTAMNASLGKINATIYSEIARADNAAVGRDDLQMQIISLQQTLQAQYCAPPPNPAFTGYNYVFDVVPNWVSQTVGCSDPTDSLTCLVNNTGYETFAEAWLRCGDTPGCGRVMKYRLDGKFYLRRRSDLHSLVLSESMQNDDLDVSKGDPLALMINYVCMPVCPTSCQFPTCGHCATGEFMANAGVARCSTPRRDSSASVFEFASGNCPAGTEDCRFCALDDLAEFQAARGPIVAAKAEAEDPGP